MIYFRHDVRFCSDAEFQQEIDLAVYDGAWNAVAEMRRIRAKWADRRA